MFHVLLLLIFQTFWIFVRVVVVLLKCKCLITHFQFCYSVFMPYKIRKV